MRPKVTERGWEIPIGMLPLRWREHMIRVFSTDEYMYEGDVVVKRLLASKKNFTRVLKSDDRIPI